MKKLLLSLLIAVPAFGQTIYLSNNSPSSHPTHAKRGTTITVDAVVNGVNNKGVIWTSSGGTLTNATCTANGPCTVGITSTTATSGSPISLTATSAANSSVSKTLYVWFDASPTPQTAAVTQYLVNSSNLATLQARATTSNKMWNAILTTNNANWSGLSGWTWTCNGGTGTPASSPGYPMDGAAYYMSLIALLNPGTGPSSGAGSCKWGQIARDLWVYTWTHVQNGDIAVTGNIWSDESDRFVLGMNFGMQAGIFSSADITQARLFCAWFLHQMNGTDGYTGTTVTADSTKWNTSQIFNTGNEFALGGQRYMGNNYSASKMLYAVGFSLMFHDDTTNDPLLTGTYNTCGAARGQMCSDYTVGSLHAWWTYTVQALLPKFYAHLEDPAITIPLYNAAWPSGGFSSNFACAFNYGGSSGPCLGDGWGGEPSEGSWYSYSLYRLRLALNLIQSAGYDDPIVYGPAMSLSNSAYWDMKLWSDRGSMTSFYTQSSQANAGYGFFTTGDTYSTKFYRSPTEFTPEANMLSTDTFGTQRTDRTNDLLWLTMDTAFGGINGTNGGCTNYCGYNAEMVDDWASSTVLDMFLTQPVNDPTTLAPTDPATNYPLQLWNASFNQHQEYRTTWNTSGTALQVYGNNSQIDHEHSITGRFDLYANGGFITGGRTEFTNYNDVMNAAAYSNMVSIVDGPGLASGRTADCLASSTAPYGGPMWHAYEKGIATATHSEMPTYAFYGIDQTPVYNGCSVFGINQFTDTQTADREVMFVPGSNLLFVYDHIAVGSSTSSYKWNLITTGNATVSSNVATWNTASGNQSAKLTSLLPASASMAYGKLVNYVSVSAPHLNLQTGTTMQATCTASYGDGTTGDVSSLATWSLSSTANATISSTGLITANTAASGISVRCDYGGALDGASGSFNTTASASSGTFSGNTPDNTQVTDWEKFGNISVTPLGAPLSSNFLHVLEYGAVGFTSHTASLVQSTSGTGYDCSVASTAMVCFMRTLGSFINVTYAASGATTHYVSDLTPNTMYAVSGVGTPSSVTTDAAGVATFSATGTGNITISTSLIAAPTHLTGTVIFTNSTIH